MQKHHYITNWLLIVATFEYLFVSNAYPLVIFLGAMALLYYLFYFVWSNDSDY